MSKNVVYDVSKGNNIVSFVLSLPFVALAWLLFLMFWPIALVACLIGRRRALNLLYKTKEIL